MKYIVRLNPRAFNPLTHKVSAHILWEVEQCEKIGGNGRMDSEKVIWHCADVRIDGRHVREFFQLPKEGEKLWQYDCFGVCTRGQDNAIEIRTEAPNVSGN
jgi:hypothetical protein